MNNRMQNNNMVKFHRILANGLLCALFVVNFHATLAFADVPVLSITSPAPGTVVKPGSTLRVTVSSTLALSSVAIFGKSIQAGAGGSPPYNIDIHIPSGVMGKTEIAAFGIDSANKSYSSAPISIDIESDAPKVDSLIPSLEAVMLSFPGSQTPLSVTANFTDGSTKDITKSSAAVFASTNESIVTFDQQSGFVTAVGAGKTELHVTYGDAQRWIPVSVPKLIPGDMNSDRAIDSADLAVIQNALNTRATTPNDARDLNHDGKIDAADARLLVNLCTKPRCAR